MLERTTIAFRVCGMAVSSTYNPTDIINNAREIRIKFASLKNFINIGYVKPPTLLTVTPY
jgi:hypothetical protein